MRIDVTEDFSFELPNDIHGIVAHRWWILYKGILRSLVHDSFCWDKPMLVTNPTAPSWVWGFHAYRLGTHNHAWTLGQSLILNTLGCRGVQVWGLVELRGSIIEHTDGTLRGEWVRPLVLFLPTNLAMQDLMGDVSRLPISSYYYLTPAEIFYWRETAQIQEAVQKALERRYDVYKCTN